MNLKNAIASGRGKKAGQVSLPSHKRVLPLDEIHDRPHGSTRGLSDDHVAELVESIAAVGLIQPLAVDRVGHLLAGGHRRAALLELREQEPVTFEKKFPGGNIPVRIFNFNAAEDEAQSLAIEAAENEKRRDYTPAEVRELADRLVDAGYRNTRGKPKAGEKALKPAIALIIGKSTKTVQRYLNPETGAKKKAQKQTSQKGTRVPISKWVKVLEQIELNSPDHLKDGDAIADVAGQLREMLQDAEWL